MTASAESACVPDETTLGSRTVQKLKIRLLPWLFLLFVVAYIDRINIGFAALTMNRELGISSQQYGAVAGVFFFGYFIFEVPSNLLLHKIGARIWMARILLTWGILASATGLVQNLHQLYAVRFLLGLAEAGYFPGIVLYLTYWFPRSERAQVVALFTTAVPIASIVGAPISGMILDHFHWLGVSSWRWLLILEGLPAILCGILTYFLLPSRPPEASFLSSEERECLCADIAREEQQKLERYNYSVLQTVVHGRLWYLTAIQFGMMIGLYTLIYWTPQLQRRS
jgi:ACS family tartrate transporter-like MFS transporter